MELQHGKAYYFGKSLCSCRYGIEDSESESERPVAKKPLASSSALAHNTCAIPLPALNRRTPSFPSASASASPGSAITLSGSEMLATTALMSAGAETPGRKITSAPHLPS